MTKPSIVTQPPLLFVHGAWHGAWCWEEKFLPWFRERGHEVHVLDLRGHGKGHGPARLPWHSAADYVADVRSAVEKIGRPTVLVGHSMGGYVVQKYLERHDAAGAVLVAAVPPRGVIGVTLDRLRSRPMDVVRGVLGFTLYPLVAGKERARELFYSPRMPEAELERYAALLGNESYRAFLDMLLLALPRPSRSRGRAPMLVLGGELDRVFPPADVNATAQAHSTTATIFPGMGHNLMLEPGWEQVAGHIEAWMADLR